MSTPKNIGKRNRVIAATILSVIGIAGSLKLKSTGLISEPTLVFFVGFAIVAGLFIAFLERIKSLNLYEMQLTLHEMKETEASVKEVATALLDVIEAKSHTLMLESYDADAANQAIERLKKLM